MPGLNQCLFLTLYAMVPEAKDIYIYVILYNHVFILYIRKVGYPMTSKIQEKYLRKTSCLHDVWYFVLYILDDFGVVFWTSTKLVVHHLKMPFQKVTEYGSGLLEVCSWRTVIYIYIDRYIYISIQRGNILTTQLTQKSSCVFPCELSHIKRQNCC